MQAVLQREGITLSSDLSQGSLPVPAQVIFLHALQQGTAIQSVHLILSWVLKQDFLMLTAKKTPLLATMQGLIIQADFEIQLLVLKPEQIILQGVTIYLLEMVLTQSE